MKMISESTLLNWRRQVLKGTASKATRTKLVRYVEDVILSCGFRPEALMSAYYKAVAQERAEATLNG